MAELLLEAFLSVAFEKLFERLASSELVNFIRGKKSIINDKQLKELNLKLKRASRLLNDAEDRQLEEPAVREWLDDLKDVIYRAEALVDEIDYEVLSKKLEHDESNKTKSRFRKRMKSMITSGFSKPGKTVQGDEIAKILKDLSSLLENEVGRGLKVEDAHKNSTPTGSSSKIPPAPWREERHVHGRNADKEEIMELLLSNDVWGGKIGVLPIVGMGGLGKTTLAQLVYDDGRWKERDFALKPWVTVSTDFDIFKIMKCILQQVSPNSTCSDEEQMLQRALQEALRGKKFLIVLDDVWDDTYHKWDALKSTFEFGERESRVIVTTRIRGVALKAKTGPIHDLKLVSDDYCWQIFVEHAFDGDLNADQRLQSIGRRLVRKCGGLPLAVTSIGGLLRSEKDPTKWNSILNSNVWERCNKIQTGEILPSALWLSYRYLPSCLKQCFAYCSVFPKDHVFKKKEMILLWMAEGFLQSGQQERQIEDVGEEYFNNLISRSLFQRSAYKETFVIHDLLHDLAMFVSREFCLALDDNKKLELLKSKTRHLSYSSDTKHRQYESMRTILSKAKHLRTFIGLGPSYVEDGQFVAELLSRGRFLRVFSTTHQTTLPSLFSNLKHLRYLNLSATEIQEIPHSVCTMYNLQTLLLSDCWNLTRLPKDMGKLINLRHLETTGTCLVEMPPQMGNLKQLQTLTNFVLSDNDHSSCIKELAELQQLRGKLCISGLQNVNNVEDVLKANLRGKEKLSELELQWEGDTSDRGIEKYEKELDALQPHTNLKKISISGYAGSNFPRWVGDYSKFSNIVSMTLIGNKHCCSLPPLGQLPSLENLIIKSFRGVETIGDEFYGNISSGAVSFPSLEELKIEDMPKWNKWSFNGNQNESGCFPRLKRLRLLENPKVEGSLPNSQEIEDLHIRGCDGLMESFPLIHYPSLEKLFLKECDSINSLPLDCFPMLKALHLDKFQNLESITTPEEIGATLALESLRSLTLFDCNHLRSLPQHMHRLLPSLAYLEIYGCPEIESFPEGGLPSKLEDLRIWNCSKLVAQHGHWDFEGLTSLKSLQIGDSDVVLDSFPAGSLPAASLDFLWLFNLSGLQSLNGSAFEKVTSLHTLWLSNCKELQYLPEQVLRPTFLSSLWINECPILERRYRKEKGEDWDKISHIPDINIRGKTTYDFMREAATQASTTNA